MIARAPLAALAALGAYLVLASLDWAPYLLALALLGIAASYWGRRSWRRDLVLAGAVAFQLSAITLVTLSNGRADVAAELGRHATALAGAAALFLALMRAAPPGAWRERAAPFFAWVPNASEVGDRLELWHGRAFVLAAGALAVGEGAGFGGAALLALCLVLRRRAVDWRALGSPAALRLFAALGLFAATGALAWALGGEGVLRPAELGRLGPFALLPIYLLSARALGARWCGRAAAAFVAVLGLSALTALAQYAFDIGAEHPTMTPFSIFSSKRQIFVPGSGRAVAGGFYFHRLTMAHVLVAGCGVLVARQLAGSPRPARRLLEGLFLGLFAVTLLFTFTRAAPVALGFAAIVCMLLAGRRWRPAALGAAAFVILLGVAHPGVRGRLATIGTATSLADRALIWDQALAIIDSHPFGAGLANYPSLVAAAYAELPEAKVLPRTYAHNLVLSAWAECGPIGMLAWAMLWAGFAWACMTRLADAAAGSTARQAALCGLFLTTGFWVIGATHDVLFHKPVALVFAAMVGTVVALLHVAERAK